MIHDIDRLQEPHNWPGLKSIVMIESERENREKIERKTRFYITSLTIPAERLGLAVRNYWAVENSLHWVMDMMFRDDECRVRIDHAPANFTWLSTSSEGHPEKIPPLAAQKRRLGR
ncbi:MAG: ISAs1 family transposase [Rhodospirillales bacterium]|nr:ISAs1 family transposase [Rhodospirillales bacterium]